MKQHPRKPIMAVVLIAALIVPMATATAQSRKREQRHASQPTQNSNSTPPSSGTDTPRRLTQVKLPMAMIKAIRKTEALQKAVSISGRTIKTRAGASLWKLENGSYVLLGQGDSTGPVAAYSQAVLKPLPFGAMYFAVCLCLLKSGNDSCRFNGDAKKENCGGQGCCSFAEGEIAADGSVRMY